MPDRFRTSPVREREPYSEAPRTRPMGAGRVPTGRTRDGTEFPFEISLSPIETEGGLLATSIVRDITERRRAEDPIQASLREKEVPLKEVHHRVRNSVRVTSSLLKHPSAGIQDAHARDLFGESQNRIRSMALVHEMLYQSSDLSRIELTDSAPSLASLLWRSCGVDPRRLPQPFRPRGFGANRR